MLSFSLNYESQTVDILEAGGVVAQLSFAEATRKGLRCSVEHEFEYEEREGESGKEMVAVAQKRTAGNADLSKLSARRSEMTVSKKDGNPAMVPCIEVLKNGAKLVDVMLPFDDSEIG